MNGVITDTKKGMVEFLQERERYFLYEEPNPFTEASMVTYINNGLKKLDALGINDDTVVTMYHKDNELAFKIDEEE